MFSPQRNIIEHTLAHADDVHSPVHEILSAGTEVTFLDTGIVKFEPNTACESSVVISCGMRGDEAAPIEMVSRIIEDLRAEEQKCGQRILFVVANPWAINANLPFASIDMNRLFCGHWQTQDLGLKEVKRAAKLEAYIANFFAEEPVTVRQRYHFDCRALSQDHLDKPFAVYPKAPERNLLDKQRGFLSRADLLTVHIMDDEASTLCDFTARHQKTDSLILMLGQSQPLGKNDLKSYVSVDYALRELIAGEPLPTQPTKRIQIMDDTKE